MSHAIPHPHGYMSKEEAAEFLGVGVKTIDRRIKSEPLLCEILKAGRRVWLSENCVRAYFEFGKKRGRI